MTNAFRSFCQTSSHPHLSTPKSPLKPLLPRNPPVGSRTIVASWHRSALRSSTHGHGHEGACRTRVTHARRRPCRFLWGADSVGPGVRNCDTPSQKAELVSQVVHKHPDQDRSGDNGRWMWWSMSAHPSGNPMGTGELLS